MAEEELRVTLRAYVLLEIERSQVARGSSREHLRGDARAAWLARTRHQLEGLRWKLIALTLLRPRR
jgi:hypothetical protein